MVLLDDLIDSMKLGMHKFLLAAITAEYIIAELINTYLNITV